MDKVVDQGAEARAGQVAEHAQIGHKEQDGEVPPGKWEQTEEIDREQGEASSSRRIVVFIYTFQ